ncbi:MAG: universal stress protein [Bacteroidetes bacterium]|jgi:nucleotide-binding universal stress UspA family protein|nr:universal stress protein [Bacteroidota bacterium]
MAQLQRLLLARDFSSGSDPALRLALTLARTHDGEVHTFFADVLEPNPFDPPDAQATPLDRIRMRLRQRSEETIQTAGYDPDDVRMKHEVIRDAAPGPAILRYAETHDIDCILMGTHGRRGVRKALLGSVATEVVRLAPCPVLTVRPTHDVTADGITHIVVPVDFSPAAANAARYADELAQALGASVTLLHAVETFSMPDVYGITSDDFVPRDLDATVDEALEEMADVMTSEVTTTVVRGHPAAMVEDYAEEHAVDLIVMPTRGQSGMQRFLMGSVAERVISRAPCPVLSSKDFTPHLTSTDAAAASA